MKSTSATIAQYTRWYRRIHRYVAISMVVFMLVLGITGLLLAWKSELSLKPPSNNQVVTSEMVSIHTLQQVAQEYITNQLSKNTTTPLDPTIDRIDIRLQKGIAKVRFTYHYTELQIALSTGKVVQVAERNDTFVERIHDGSILDIWFGNSSDSLKLTYATLTSISLILLSFTGFWLYVNPKRIRKRKG